jgi:aminopeptidase N
MKRLHLFLYAGMLLFAACRTTSPPVAGSSSRSKNIPPEQQVYRAAYTRVMDLEHMRLLLRPVWDKKQMEGEATLTLHPHWYSGDSVTLNARGMDLHRVARLEAGGDTLPLEFTYDSFLLHIALGKQYARNETYTLYIAYTARPEELPHGGSAAIRDDKGLYFINADGRDPETPRQLWTQGETESNSAWFPTIEDPQQRMTQEISLTVDSAMETLSNGLLVQTTCNIDGTRTDTWKQTLPCPPYLTMVAAGDFAVTEDHWRDRQVQYYTEHAFAPFARMIFGRTPDMMEFYSTAFGVAFPWEKYSQVAVRDFVSGAMENTTAVVHLEGIQQTPREMLDGNYEDFISHELAHHWFGDLVTCESWSNVVLNEGFANYCEYLWREHAYGRDDADYLNQKDLNTYLYSAGISDPDVVRFHYADREEMYDPVSYNKGGRILHMLRKAVGDDAFFASLKLYLESHRFAPVEIHDLRLAFEKVTGEDLNWFFNEWYLNHGYPKLVVRYNWDEVHGRQEVTLEQVQDFSNNPLYRIPLDIDIYSGDTKVRHRVVLEAAKQTFRFDLAAPPDLVNVDAEKMLCGTKRDTKPRKQFVYQYYHAPLYLDRYEAVVQISDGAEANSAEGAMLMDALHDPYWSIRAAAVRNAADLIRGGQVGIRDTLTRMARYDEKSDVRAAALRILAKQFDDTATWELLSDAAGDSSYRVIQAAFSLLADRDEKLTRAMAERIRSENSAIVQEEVAGFYVHDGRPEYDAYFRDVPSGLRPAVRRRIIERYGNYLSMQDAATRQAGMDWLDSLSRNGQPWSTRMAAYRSMSDLSQELLKRTANPEGDPRVLRPSDTEKMKQQAAWLDEAIRRNKASETDMRVVRFLEDDN